VKNREFYNNLTARKMRIVELWSVGWID